MSNKKFSFSEKKVNQRIKEIRGKCSSTEFSKKLGFSISYLSEIETGKRKPSLEMLYKISQNEKINLHWLLTGEGMTFVGESDSLSDIDSNLQTCETCGQPYNLESLMKEKEKQLEEKERIIASKAQLNVRLEQENVELRAKIEKLDIG